MQGKGIAIENNDLINDCFIIYNITCKDSYS